MRLLQRFMIVMRMQLHSKFCFFLTLLAFSAGSAGAAFIGPYDPTSFVLTNMNSDGFAVFRPDGSLVLTGGNNGSGTPGTTNFLVSAAGTGLVTFNFSYSSLDAVLAEVVGYMIGSSFNLLADRDGTAGPVSFAVTAGQTFGFRLTTEDNTGEPGILTVSNFAAPAGSGVPEPSTAMLMAAGLATAAFWRHRLGRKSKGLR